MTMVSSLRLALPHLAAALISQMLIAVAAEAAADLATLNRFTFTPNVFAGGEGDTPESWVVLFCVDWFPTCNTFKQHFLSLASEHGRASDDDLFSRKTRFAEVDCAVDKVLCNSQDVDSYPTVVHYRRGGRAGEWSTGGRDDEKDAKAFTKWVEKQLQPGKPAPPAADVDERSDDAATGGLRRRQVSIAQLVWMVVAFATFAMWLSQSGLELWQGMQHMRVALGQRRPHTTEKSEKPAAEPLEAVVEARLVTIKAVQCLPEVWALGRGSIEL